MRTLLVVAVLAVGGFVGVRHALPDRARVQPAGLALPKGPVVVNVWSSWCSACREEGPELAAFERAHPEAAVVGVDSYERDPAAGPNWARGWGWRHASVDDPSGRLARKLRAEGLPTTLFLDARHHVVQTLGGVRSQAELETAYRLATA